MDIQIQDKGQNLENQYHLPNIGFKLFDKIAGDYFSFVIGEEEKDYIFNKWLDEKDFRWQGYEKTDFLIDGDSMYQPGFHIFKNVQDALDGLNEFNLNPGLVICEVEFKEVTTIAKDSGFKTNPSIIVAKKMKIIKEISGPQK